MKTNPNQNDIVIVNAGKNIIEPTNYWDSKFAQNGFYMVSTANGCISLLVPDCELYEVPNLVNGTARVVVSVLNDYESKPDTPYGVSVITESGGKPTFGLLILKYGVMSVPSFEERNRKWTFSIWGRKNGKIHKFMERPAYVCYADSIEPSAA